MKIQLIFKNSRSIVIYVIYDRKTRCRDFTRGYFPTMMIKYRNFNVEMQKKKIRGYLGAIIVTGYGDLAGKKKTMNEVISIGRAVLG